MTESGASLAALKALVEAFNAHDLDRIMSFFAEDAVLEMPRGPSRGAAATSAPPADSGGDDDWKSF